MIYCVIPRELEGELLERMTEYYRGNPEERKAERRKKMSQARHQRRERNLGLEQGTSPYAAEEVVV